MTTLQRRLRISVIIPAKDDAEMLERCLDALTRQTRPADEIIVVDNGSTDDTAEVATRHGVTLLHESRPGITAAASHGYDAATGDVLARCDADSIVASDWIARLEYIFESHPEAVAATGAATFYDLSALQNGLARGLYLGAYFVAVGAALANPPLFGSNLALRRETWARLSPTVPRDNPDLHDDFDLSFRISPSEKVIFDPALRVAISGRPFRNPLGLVRRFSMAGTTMREHFPRELPPARWSRKLAGRMTTRPEHDERKDKR